VEDELAGEDQAIDELACRLIGIIVDETFIESIDRIPKLAQEAFLEAASVHRFNDRLHHAGEIRGELRRPFGLGGGTESEPGVWAGVHLIVHEPVLRVLITASIVSLLGMGMVNVANYPLSIHLGGGTEGYGALEALLGGGGLLGAAIAARMLSASRAPLIVTITFAVSGLGLLLAGLAPVLAVALAGMAIAGAGRGLGDVADTTLVQARTDDARRSRVFAAQDGAAHAAYSAAMLVGGLIVTAAGARAAVLTAGACGLAASLIASRMLRSGSLTRSRTGSRPDPVRRTP
jgi:hypothetical protein